MTVTVADVFPAVRGAMAFAAREDLDAITLETHIYDDLALDSLDVADLFFALEDEFGMELPDETLTDYIPSMKEQTWEQFTERVNAMFRAYLAAGALPLDAASREAEVIKLSARHGVKPFTVGFVCAWLVEILNATPLAEGSA